MQKTGQWIKERTEGRNWCDGVSEERVEYMHLSLFLKEVGVEHGDVPNHTGPLWQQHRDWVINWARKKVK